MKNYFPWQSFGRKLVESEIGQREILAIQKLYSEVFAVHQKLEFFEVYFPIFHNLFEELTEAEVKAMVVEADVNGMVWLTLQSLPEWWKIGVWNEKKFFLREAFFKENPVKSGNFLPYFV